MKGCLYEPMAMMCHELRRMINSLMHLKLKKNYRNIKSDSKFKYERKFSIKLLKYK